MYNMTATVPSICDKLEIQHEAQSTSTGLEGTFSCPSTCDKGTFEYRRMRRPTYKDKPDFLVGDIVLLGRIKGRGARQKNGQKAEIVDVKGAQGKCVGGVLLKGTKF